MTKHRLKADEGVFQASWEGLKPWEIRFNDRDFRPGDTFILEETEFTGEAMKLGAPLNYTGRKIEGEIDYVLHGPMYGIKEGWVILSTNITNCLEE